jgi:predicted P-loop ATPase
MTDFDDDREYSLNPFTARAIAREARGGLIKDSKGKPIWNAENACTLIETDDAWEGVLATDDFAGLTLLLKPIPGTPVARARFNPRPLTDTDITAAVRWFNRNGFPDATKATTADAVYSTAAQTVISPVRHFLEALRWDGTSRVDNWLATYCGAPPSRLTSKVGRAWLVSAVARALIPGCKADCALVLEGKQGAGKSSALKALAGRDWFHDGLSDLHSKDASAGLRGKWIIELPELSAMRRSDVEAVKAFLSRTEERYRPAYGRAEVIEPRRCVFAGTTVFAVLRSLRERIEEADATSVEIWDAAKDWAAPETPKAA